MSALLCLLRRRVGAVQGRPIGHLQTRLPWWLCSSDPVPPRPGRFAGRENVPIQREYRDRYNVYRSLSQFMMREIDELCSCGFSWQFPGATVNRIAVVQLGAASRTSPEFPSHPL